LRFLARPAGDQQVYSHFVPEVCDQFIKVQSGDDVRSKEEAVKAIREAGFEPDGLPPVEQY
jgi:hypothetical protein